MVTVGNGFTVKTATEEMVAPHGAAEVTSTRYFLPFMALVTPVRVKLELVAPAILAHAATLSCHW